MYRGCIALIYFACLQICAIAQSVKSARQIYDSTSPSVFLIFSNDRDGKPNIFGTGFEIAPRTIATNAHVIAGGSPLLVFGTNRIPAQIVNIDSVNDLAILTVGIDLPASSNPLTLSAQRPSPGDQVFAIGNPEGLEKSISQGIVSAIRNVNGRTLLQVTSPISHGSSGGPILNDQGEVVAVTVSSRTDGQNLNFAIPIAYLDSLLHAKPNSISASLTPAVLDALVVAFRRERFSKAPDSPYQARLNELRKAIRLAALQINSAPALSQLMCMTYNNTPDEDEDAVADAARKLIKIGPASDGEPHAVLAYALSYQADYVLPGPERTSLIQEGESEADLAIKIGGRGSATAEYAKGVFLSMRRYPEGIPLFQKVLKEDPKLFACGYNLQVYAYRKLISYEDLADLYDQAEKSFAGLVATGEASASDWGWEGTRRHAHKDFLGAAIAFEKSDNANPFNACTTARNYFDAPGDNSEKILSEGRKCIDAYARYGSPPEVNLNGLVGVVHLEMATVLNDRGVYTQALNLAQQGMTVDPTETDLLYQQARALQKLGRAKECISAAQQAVVASNGGIARYHLQLGSCHFDAGNWNAAEASLRTAAERDKTDAAPAYKPAQTLKKQGNSAEAKVWFQEALNRHPDERLKAEILASQN